MKNVFLMVATALLLLVGWTVDGPRLGLATAVAQEAEEAPEVDESQEPEEAEAERQRRGVRRLGDVVSEGADEWSMDMPDIPPSPVQAQPEVSLPDADQDARLQNLLARRAFAPQDPEIRDEMEGLMDEVEADTEAALAAGNLERAQQLVAVIGEFSPDRAVVDRVRAEITRRASLAQTLAEADAALAEGRLVNPPGQSAVDLYRQVLAADAGNQTALDGLASTHQAVLARAVEMAEEFDFEGAEALLVRGEDIHDDAEAVQDTRTRIAEFRTGYLQEVDQTVRADIDAGRFDEAEAGITELVALGHDRARIESLQASLTDGRMYGSFEPGQVFAESLSGLDRDGPEMVVIPAGSFMMGSPENEADRSSNEGPRHRVTFERGFALGRTEVTVGEFRLFIEETGYRTDAERAGSSRVYDVRTGRMDRQNRIDWRHDYLGERADDNLPVVHVSWNDAQAYVDWLSERTGRTYRLPSEAEFEYALRADSQTRYWWGDGSPDRVVENVTGDGDTSPTNARWNVAFRRYSDGHWGPAPVGSFEANPFGLYDMGGNVMEWTEDCWHDSFVRAPGDGSAWVNPGCDRRVIKGGSWSSTPAMSRSAFRLSSTDSSTDMRVGFRVARDL